MKLADLDKPIEAVRRERKAGCRPDERCVDWLRRDLGLLRRLWRLFNIRDRLWLRSWRTR